MKALVVGSGPSHNNMDFIKNFEGIIISCDRTARDLVTNGIIPDYITYAETQDDLFKVVLDFLPDSFSKLNTTLVHRSSACGPSLVGDRAEKLGLKATIFDLGGYVNNVGLYSVIFAVNVLGIKELHLIGLDHTGGLQHEGIPYPDKVFDEWVNTFRHWLITETPDCKITDHSGGRLADILRDTTRGNQFN